MSLDSQVGSASASRSSFGFGVNASVYIRNLSFTNTSGNSYTFGYNVDYYSGYYGSSTSSRVAYTELVIDISDANIVTRTNSYGVGSPDNQNYNSSNYTIQTISNNTPIKFRIRAVCRGSANSGTIDVDAVFDETFYISTSQNNMIFAKTAQNDMIILPKITTSNKGQLFFIKNVTGGNYVKIVPEGTSNTIDGTSTPVITLNNRNGAILFNDGTNWFIGNLYKTNLNTTSTSSYASGKTGTATANSVNIFNVNNNTSRQSGDNLCTLPAAVQGGLCMVVYAGNNSDKYNNNALVFRSNASNTYTIDYNYYNNSSSQVYIVVNESGASQKSTGILFISDGSGWYIMGSVPTFGVSWGTSALGSTATTINSTNDIQINLTNTSAKNILIKDNTVNSTNLKSQLLIMKSKLSSPDTYYSQDSTHTLNYFNENVKSIVNVLSGTNYSCYWFVCENRSGILHYYPIINYT